MVRNERLTSTLDGDFVVFLIGMRINNPLLVHKWLPVARAMPLMIRELLRQPELGFIHAVVWFAFAEAFRVLKPGGALLFNGWDRIEENDFAHAVTASLESLFPDDPPRFLARTPHGYCDHAVIARDLRAGGFVSPRIQTVAARNRAASPRIPAFAYCHGTPLRNEIEARDRSRLAEATDCANDADHTTVRTRPNRWQDSGNRCGR